MLRGVEGGPVYGPFEFWGCVSNQALIEGLLLVCVGRREAPSRCDQVFGFDFASLGLPQGNVSNWEFVA